LTVPRGPEVRWVARENLTEEQIAAAREALRYLARMLGRISARASHEMGITFDMDDPEVARDVMKMTFEAAFLSTPPARKAGKRSKAPSR
jgi:hypothetical protein